MVGVPGAAEEDETLFVRCFYFYGESLTPSGLSSLRQSVGVLGTEFPLRQAYRGPGQWAAVVKNQHELTRKGDSGKCWVEAAPFARRTVEGDS